MTIMRHMFTGSFSGWGVIGLCNPHHNSERQVVLLCLSFFFFFFFERGGPHLQHMEGSQAGYRTHAPAPPGHQILTPLSHQGTPISSLLLGNRCTERLGDLPKVLEFEPLWPDFRVGGINFCPCLEVNSPILLQTG